MLNHTQWRLHRYFVFSMKDLNDATIREALLRKLERQKSRPRAVLQELHVHTRATSPTDHIGR
jgi:hypothetical protein